MRGLSLFLISASFAYSQAPAPPSGAQPAESTEAAESASAKQPSRGDTHIFGVVPNYNAVNDPTHPFEPIGAREKFVIAVHDGFDPFSWVVSGLYAGAGQWQNQYPEYGQGAQGYAKRYGQSFADGAVGDFMTEAILPTLLHEDPRYFRLGQGSSIHRIGYAVSRVLVTRTDSGRSRFNTSEIAGNLAAAGLSNLYVPAADRDLPQTLEKFTVSVVSDAGFNILKEFWPDWRRKFLRR